MKQQLIFLNGGVPKENYNSYYEYLENTEYNPRNEGFENWNKTLGKRLGDDWEFLRAPFPNTSYADYDEWKLMFQKMLPYFREGMNLCATSLGATFLFKYIGEQELPVRIKKLFLVAPAMSDTKDEILGSFTFDFEFVYHKVKRSAEVVYIYHSRDDTMVPFEQSLELKTYFPEAIFREFDDRGHFHKEERLPELEQDLKR